MDEQSKRVLIGEILDPVTSELEAALTRTEWELTDDFEGLAMKYGGMTEEAVQEGMKYGGMTEEAVQVQGWRVKYLRPVDGDDTEGQGGSWFYGLRPGEGEDDDVVGLLYRYGGMGQTDEDIQGLSRVRLRSDGEDDASGQGFRISYLFRPVEDDTEGQVYIRFQKPDVP